MAKVEVTKRKQGWIGRPEHCGLWWRRARGNEKVNLCMVWNEYLYAFITNGSTHGSGMMFRIDEEPAIWLPCEIPAKPEAPVELKNVCNSQHS